MVQATLFDGNPYIDITARKSHSPVTSQDANKKVAPRKAEDRKRITSFIRWNGNATLKDVVAGLMMPVQTASARLSELKASGEIEVTGERREGCAVVRLK